MEKLVILGASYIQVPLMIKAKEMGFETHVFSWDKGRIHKQYCDHFYPISIREKEKIFNACKQIQPAGICSIGSDLAMITVNYVARKLDLISNGPKCTDLSTDKYQMRTALSKHGLRCPKFKLVSRPDDLDTENLLYPMIIKPTDRSGSRGISIVQKPENLRFAIQRALDESLSNQAILEEFIEGREISVEMISWKGDHFPLTITDKVTTGPPFFVELEHHQPALFPEDTTEQIYDVTRRALNALDHEYGASHTELLLSKGDELFVVEVGARMAGDQIGSDLVPLSTGYDFIKGTIEIVTNNFNKPQPRENGFSGIHYITPPSGKVLDILDHSANIQQIVESQILIKPGDHVTFPVTKSADRSAYFIYKSNQPEYYTDKSKIIEIIIQ
jgi:biotin carboxylase